MRGTRLAGILTDTNISIADVRSRSARHKPWFFVAFALIPVIAVLASMYYGAGAKPPRNELKTPAPYGWQTSKDLGTTFTDGLNLITVTPQARGPLRLISAKPLMDDGGTVRVIGVLARVNPDMLPPGSKIGSFQEASGFPPALPHTAGAVPVEDLIVQPPEQGEDRWIELQIGYEVVAPGRTVRRGIELVYEYEGALHKTVVPSYMAVCAPATATCEPEYDR